MVLIFALAPNWKSA